MLDGRAQNRAHAEDGTRLGPRITGFMAMGALPSCVYEDVSQPPVAPVEP
jgi:hypothetical protein